MRFDGSCIRESSCWELFDCPATITRGTCPISGSTFSANRCSTNKLVGICTAPSNRQNCGITWVFNDVFNDPVKSLDAAQTTCSGVNDGEWSSP
jgi:hypothetical protein